MFPVGRQPPSGSPKLHRAPLYAHHPARRRSRWLLIGLALLGLAFWYWRTGSPKELQNAKDGEDSNLDDFDSRIDNEFNSKDARDGSGKEAADERGGIDGVDQANADSLDSLITKRNSNANWFPVGDVSKLPGGHYYRVALAFHSESPSLVTTLGLRSSCWIYFSIYSISPLAPHAQDNSRLPALHSSTLRR